jgi:integrase
MKPNTVKSIRATLIRALNAARKGSPLKRRDPNVAADTEIPAVIQKKPPALSDAQLARLLDVLAGDPIEEIVIVALGTGCRISEVLGLLWANVDYDAEELSITGAIKSRPVEGRDAPYRLIREAVKTKDERTTHMSAPVAEALKVRHKRQQQERRDAGAAWKEQGLVFTDAHGGPLRPATISSRFGQRYFFLGCCWFFACRAKNQQLTDIIASTTICPRPGKIFARAKS